MKKLSPILLSTIFLFGCSPYTLVSNDTYNDANLSSYKTFRIVTPDEGKLPPGMQMVTYYNIAAAIREQMIERGFSESPNSPMLINIGITIHREIATEPAIPPGYWTPFPTPGFMPPPGFHRYFMYPRNYYWNSYYTDAKVITGIYKEGVLTMDIVNIEQKLPLYSSSVATIIDNGQSQFRNLSGIAEAVKTLFSKFPVPLLPQYKH